MCQLVCYCDLASDVCRRWSSTGKLLMMTRTCWQPFWPHQMRRQNTTLSSSRGLRTSRCAVHDSPLACTSEQSPRDEDWLEDLQQHAAFSMRVRLSFVLAACELSLCLSKIAFELPQGLQCSTHGATAPHYKGNKRIKIVW